MRWVVMAALSVFALAAGCNNFHYDEGKGHFVNDPPEYRGLPPGSQW